MTIAQRMRDMGLVLAGDIYSQKCDILRQRAARHALTCVQAVQRDASSCPPPEWCGTFDRVLCDVPCSGLGVIRRKPEIRYKTPQEFADLPALQLRILTQAATLVRPGGVLQYSTCTLRPEENEQVVAAFLAENPAFSPRKLVGLEPCFAQSGQPVGSALTLFPHIHGTDGFFVAGFQKR
jgi:16S rRNA (cytosine967-C5)-methyltransferase